MFISCFEKSDPGQDLKIKAKAKQICVTGVGMCLYAQLVQTKNKQCKVQLYYNVIIRIYLTSVPDPS